MCEKYVGVTVVPTVRRKDLAPQLGGTQGHTGTGTQDANPKFSLICTSVPPFATG